MGYPTSTIAYSDCYEAFDRALEHPKGAKVPCESRDAAERLRTRMHYARRLHRNDNAQIYPDPDHPLHGRSPYDSIVCKIKLINDQWWLYMEPIQSFAEIIEPIEDEPEDEVVGVEEPKPTATTFKRRV